MLILVLLRRCPRGLCGEHDAHLEEKEQIACFACSELNSLYSRGVKKLLTGANVNTESCVMRAVLSIENIETHWCGGA